jgi:hypothetical protein
LLSTTAPGASAAPPPPEPTSVQCLDEFTNNANYVGDGWVGALVDTQGDFNLFCGNELTGVIHVGHPDSTGTVHPITVDNQIPFKLCWSTVVAEGTRTADGAGRSRFVFVSAAGVRGTVIVDDALRFTYAVFTETTERSPQGNDWFGCALQEG